MNNDFVKGLWGEAVEGDDGVFNGDGLPFTSRDRIADDYIVDVQIVVAAAYCGFTIECNLYNFASIGREVDAYILTSGGNGVIYITGTAVVLFGQDVPCIVGINQYNEPVIRLGSVIFDRI